MKVINRNRQLIFPTPLYVSYIEGDLSKYIELLYRDRDSGEGKDGYRKHHWKSHDDYAERPEWKELSDIILNEVNEAMDDYGLIRDEMFINNMWAQIANHNNNHDIHTHPNSYWSGILYLQTPFLCGQTIFHRDMGEMGLMQPELHSNDWNNGRWIITPEAGKMILFPSWLPHSVPQGHETSEGDRITISFTVMPRVNVLHKTAKYNYS
jgi:uncharacterized protein (TIGR02466 family)